MGMHFRFHYLRGGRGGGCQRIQGKASNFSKRPDLFYEMNCFPKNRFVGDVIINIAAIHKNTSKMIIG